ncbi:large conductance mechanosensitive channel protein MscL [candidate division WOR-3 bacterium]|nr:large conductance mechanosensitive channel protein MscL [candidate division WOR-3 bacterium]
MFKEFKKFVMRGNVIDMAVGIVIGAAFGAIVKSLVDNIIMPPFGLLLSKVDFSNLFAVLKYGNPGGPYASLAEAQAAGAISINYGVFIMSIVSFLIIALAIFLVVKGVNKLKKPEPVEISTKECPYCFSTIPVKATRCPHCTSKLD